MKNVVIKPENRSKLYDAMICLEVARPSQAVNK